MFRTRPVTVLPVLVMLLFGAVQLCWPTPAHAIGTGYYVSQSTGSDANDGTSASTPWQTLARVSSMTFQPGDQILLKRGDVWNEYLQMHGSGTSAAPITLGAYGSGPRPLIQRNGLSSDRALRWFNDPSYTRINSIAVAGAGMGIWVDSSGTSNYVDDCLAYDIAGLYGTPQPEETLWTAGIGVSGDDARITNSEVWGGGGAGITMGGSNTMMSKVYVHDQTDQTTSYAGIDFQATTGTMSGILLDDSTYYAPLGTSAIMFKDAAGSASSPVLLQNSIVRDTPDSGTNDEVGIDFEDNNDYVTIDNVVFENNAGPALEFLRGGLGRESSNVEIKNSKFIRDNWARKQSQTNPAEIEVVDWQHPNAPTNVSIHDNQYTLVNGINFFGGDGDTSGVTLADNTANSNIVYNHEPSVYAGADKTIAGNSVSLSDASASDDGGSPIVRWEQFTGPGIVAFADPNAVNTTATFPAAGTYVLRLVADDDTYFRSSYITVTTGTAPVLTNAGFEWPSTADHTYAPAGYGWTFGSGTGVQHNGGSFGAAAAPDGVQTAFVQGSGQLSQSASFMTGTYSVSFQAAKRTNYGGTQSFDVYFDSTLIGSFTPASGSFEPFTTSTFSATAGSHTVKFVGTTTGDSTDFVDAVAINHGTPPLANAGFEAPSTSDVTYGPMTQGWTFGSGTGVQHNGGSFAAATAPEGVQTAFIQNSGQISQPVTFPAGTYTVSFQAAKRTNFGGTQSFNVYVDTSLIGSYTPTSGSFVSFTTNSFTATAGSHTIRFQGTTTSGDNTDFIDAVRIN